MLWHYSHPLERIFEIDADKGADQAKKITKAVQIGQQNCDIKGGVMKDWLGILIPDLDGGVRGERASIRGLEMAKANEWILSLRSAT